MSFAFASVLLLLAAILFGLLLAAIAGSTGSEVLVMVFTSFSSFVVIALGALIVVPYLAVLSRRFHDAGLSFWFVIVGFCTGNVSNLVIALLPPQAMANRWGDQLTVS